MQLGRTLAITGLLLPWLLRMLGADMKDLASGHSQATLTL